jgi:hypothetical protein
MTIMRVPVEELLCQMVMERILVLKCSLLNVCGLLWLHPIMPGIKCRHLLRTLLYWHLPDNGEPPGAVVEGPGVCRARA